jgi:beta-glucosidase
VQLDSRAPSDQFADSSDLLDLARALDLERRVELTTGAKFWTTNAVDEIGLKPVTFTDGPFGVRGTRVDERDVALCTPCGTGLGATWDVELVRRIGELVGDEALRRDVNVVLGPTMNIQRSPLGGRGFECFSEDPLLSGRIAAAWIGGVQGRGVGTTAKHFVCNDAERKRTTVNNLVDSRALREIYLVPFEIVTKAGAWALMAAYNRVNGVHCSANVELLRAIVKDEWGWDGLVISDWFVDGETIASANAGLDLEMPAPPRLFGSALTEAVLSGAVDESVVDDKVVRLLRFAKRVGRLGGTETANEPPPLERATADELLVEAAASSFVLLKNDGPLLPISREQTRRVAVIGPNVIDPAFQGGGSSAVSMEPVPSLLEGIRHAFGEHVGLAFEPGCRRPGEGLMELHSLDVRVPNQPEVRGFNIEYLATADETPQRVSQEVRNSSTYLWLEGLPRNGNGSTELIRASAQFRPEVDGLYTFSLRGSGSGRLRIDGCEIIASPGMDDSPLAAAFDPEEQFGAIDLRAGSDVLVEVEMSTPEGRPHVLWIGCKPAEIPPEVLLERAVIAAANADAVILVIGTNKDIEREGVDRATTALDQQQRVLIERVLNASTPVVAVVNAGSAVDLDWTDRAAAVLYAWFPGQGFSRALGDVLVGTREPGGRLPITIARDSGDYAAWSTTPDDEGALIYRESIFVGYRHFDAADLRPQFCFGHGLSYADFAYESLELGDSELACGDSLEVFATVRNVGLRHSKEVVQVYVRSCEASVPRPPRELKAFAAVTLDPEQVATATFTLDARCFAYWDVSAGAWQVEPGQYEVQVGRSSRDIRLRGNVLLRGSA